MNRTNQNFQNWKNRNTPLTIHMQEILGILKWRLLNIFNSLVEISKKWATSGNLAFFWLKVAQKGTRDLKYFEYLPFRKVFGIANVGIMIFWASLRSKLTRKKYGAKIKNCRKTAPFETIHSVWICPRTEKNIGGNIQWQSWILYKGQVFQGSS